MILKFLTGLMIFCFIGNIEMSAKNSASEKIYDSIAFDKDDDGTADLKESYNYSTIAGHPRLLMNDLTLRELKNSLGENPDLFKVHQLILKIANNTLTTEPSVRVMEGKRMLSVSRVALKRIFYLSYAYRMTNFSKYLDRAEAELLSVCHFSDWNPSHFLDVGEMALAVAIGYDWLYDKLQPKTRAIIRQAIYEKAFLPSYNTTYNGFLKNKANWNQVCNGGLTLAALATYEGMKEESVKIIERALESVKIPLSDYGHDGNYAEGYMYWTYGTSFQIMMLAALDSALGNDQNLSQTKGFIESAEYILYMSGLDGLCYNYSDCYTKETPNMTMFWFADKSNNPSLLFTEKRILEEGNYARKFSEDRLLPMLMIFAHKFDLKKGVNAPSKKLWYGHGKTPVVLVRTSWGEKSDQYLGIKGGMAQTSHSHMDGGSFVYDADGIRWAMDLGMQTYLPLESKGIDLWNMSQESQRWDVFRYHNKAHNTLTINDKRHKVDGMVTILKTYDTDNKRGALMNLTPLFPDDLDLAHRTVAIMNNEYLQVEDIVKTKNENTNFRWSMVTPTDVEIMDNKTFKLSKEGVVKYLMIEANAPIKLKTWSCVPTTNYDEENPGVIIIGFESDLKKGGETYSFAVKLCDKYIQ